MRLVEVATNPHGYRVHAVALLKHYTPDKIHATTARYHISDHNFNFDISHSYSSVTGNNCRHSEQRLYDNSYCSMIAFIDLRGNPPLLYQSRLNDSQLPFHTRQCTGMLQASYQQPMSSSLNHNMLRPGPFPLAVEYPVTVLTQEAGLQIPLNCILADDCRACRYELLCSPPIRHNHSEVGKWIWLKTTRLAGLSPFWSGSVAASSKMNPLSLNLFNQDVSHSYPAKGTHDWMFYRRPG